MCYLEQTVANKFNNSKYAMSLKLFGCPGEPEHKQYASGRMGRHYIAFLSPWLGYNCERKR